MKTLCYPRNAQGDIVKLIDGSGSTVVEYLYDSWGKPISVTGTLATTLGADQPFRYRGYVYDNETQWYYLQSRYYDPVTCRFISADVLLSTGQGVIGHNSFAYCLNNPLALWDSNGHKSSVSTYNYTCTDNPRNNRYKPCYSNNLLRALIDYIYSNTSTNGGNLYIDIDKSDGLLQVAAISFGYIKVGQIITNAALRKFKDVTGKKFSVREQAVFREIYDHTFLYLNNHKKHTGTIDIIVYYPCLFSEGGKKIGLKNWISNFFQDKIYYQYWRH